MGMEGPARAVGLQHGLWGPLGTAWGGPDLSWLRVPNAGLSLGFPILISYGAASGALTLSLPA